MVCVILRHHHRSNDKSRPGVLVVQKHIEMAYPPVAGMVIDHTEDGDLQHFFVKQMYYDSDTGIYIAQLNHKTPPEHFPDIVKGLCDGWYEVDL